MRSITSFTPQGVTLFVRSRALFAEGNLVLCPQADNDVNLQLNDVDRKRSNVSAQQPPVDEKPAGPMIRACRLV